MKMAKFLTNSFTLKGNMTHPAVYPVWNKYRAILWSFGTYIFFLIPYRIELNY